MYAEYPTIFGSYLELTASDDRATALEALKRAIYLAWAASSTLPVDTGLTELPETEVRALMKTLDGAIKAGNVDEELRLMLAWYRDAFGAVFEHFGPVRSLDAFIRDVSSDDVRARAPAVIATDDRGQMGRYWRGVLSVDR